MQAASMVTMVLPAGPGATLELPALKSQATNLFYKYLVQELDHLWTIFNTIWIAKTNTLVVIYL